MKLITDFQEVKEADERVTAIEAREADVKARHYQHYSQTQNGPSAEHQQANVAAVLDNRPLPPQTDPEQAVRALQREYEAIETAKLIAVRARDDARKRAGFQICESYRPTHDKLMKRICAGLSDAFAAWTELSETRDCLWDQGVASTSLFEPNPADVLGSAKDRGSDLADFLRDAARRGYCKELRQ